LRPKVYFATWLFKALILSQPRTVQRNQQVEKSAAVILQLKAGFNDYFIAFKAESMKTLSAKPETVKRDWYVVDAAGKTLGRLSTEIALRLRGKHKPEYTPHVDTGDYIIVINASQVRVTGKKASDKMYYSHTGFPGGIKSISFEKLIAKAPEQIIQKSVKGMLPKGPLGRAMFMKLKTYAGAEHPHAAQQPKELDI
jgi:large subunit ribosomal protein L13